MQFAQRDLLIEVTGKATDRDLYHEMQYNISKKNSQIVKRQGTYFVT
jgi:hypothetical protein